jgi:hypothetical protein
MQLMQDFLTFALRADTPPAAIRANARGSNSECTVDVYVYGMRHPKDDFYSQKPRVMFWYHDVNDQASSVVRDWFIRADRLEQARFLHCETLRRLQTPIRLKFLQTMQALEAYHRLKYGNEFSLRKRVRGLVESHGVSLGELHLPVGEMVDARNYLTHPGGSSGQSEPDSVELHIMADYAQALTEACLLAEIGLPEAKAAELLGRDEQYKSAQEEWQRRHPRELVLGRDD